MILKVYSWLNISLSASNVNVRCYVIPGLKCIKVVVSCVTESFLCSSASRNFSMMLVCLSVFHSFKGCVELCVCVCL